jgi:uncharacterized protein YjiS (DUF1127 family)
MSRMSSTLVAGGTQSSYGSIFRKLGRMVRWVVSSVHRQVTIRRDERVLHEFSDDLLKDLGISRSDIYHVVRNGR